MREWSSSVCSCFGALFRTAGRSVVAGGEARGVPQSSIEHAGGGEVVQYRNRILPLGPAVLDSGRPASQTADPAQVIVFNDGERSVGVVVDQILDVVEEAVTGAAEDHP